jgi:Type IV secretory system Conjugative DNA transfer/WD domain, G-beta repeat
MNSNISGPETPRRPGYNPAPGYPDEEAYGGSPYGDPSPGYPAEQAYGGPSSRTPLGTAQWMSAGEELATFGFDDRLFRLNDDGLWEGRSNGQVWIGESFENNSAPLGYRDDRHVLLVSGTRGGKGTGLIIPNLCLWPGSSIVIDRQIAVRIDRVERVVTGPSAPDRAAPRQTDRGHTTQTLGRRKRAGAAGSGSKSRCVLCDCLFTEWANANNREHTWTARGSRCENWPGSSQADRSFRAGRLCRVFTERADYRDCKPGRHFKAVESETGRLIQTLAGHTGHFIPIAFSPDGRLLASTGDGKTVEVWDVSKVGGALTPPPQDGIPQILEQRNKEADSKH